MRNPERSEWERSCYALRITHYAPRAEAANACYAIPLNGVAGGKRATEQGMSPIIDLSSELLVDRSQVRDPYVRLLLTALGQPLARGSPWVAVDKRTASGYELLLPLINEPVRHAAA